MMIIWGHDNANLLREKYVVLELETHELPNPIAATSSITAFCVVPADRIPVTEASDLERLRGLHDAVVLGWNTKNYSLVRDAIPHLKGKFSGELDSFYEHLESRMPGGAV